VHHCSSKHRSGDDCVGRGLCTQLSSLYAVADSNECRILP
jgi:hypothetical protein